MTENAQRDYWDSVAPKKEFTTDLRWEWLQAFLKPESVVLDIGCGYARTLAQLREHGLSHLFGVDFSSEMIVRGKNLYPDLHLEVADGAQLPFPDESMDAVLLFAVLTCVAEDTEQSAMIAEIRRVLRPGGVVCVNDFLLNSDARNQARYTETAEKHNGKYPFGVFELSEGARLRHHTLEHIHELLRSFSLLQFEHITFRTMNGNTSNGFCYLGQK